MVYEVKENHEFNTLVPLSSQAGLVIPLILYVRELPRPSGPQHELSHPLCVGETHRRERQDVKTKDISYS